MKDILIILLGALALATCCLIDVYWLPEDAPPAGLYAKSGVAR